MTGGHRVWGQPSARPGRCSGRKTSAQPLRSLPGARAYLCARQPVELPAHQHVALAQFARSGCRAGRPQALSAASSSTTRRQPALVQQRRLGSGVLGAGTRHAGVAEEYGGSSQGWPARSSGSPGWVGVAQPFCHSRPMATGFRGAPGAPPAEEGAPEDPAAPGTARGPQGAARDRGSGVRRRGLAVLRAVSSGRKEPTRIGQRIGDRRSAPVMGDGGPGHRRASGPVCSFPPSR